MNELMKPLGEREAVKARLPYTMRVAETFGVDDHTWKTLVESIYPNATSANSVALVLSACKAKGLDPLEKPYHIVPMYSSATRSYVDTIWPSVGLYRIQAARSGEYAGIDEVQYGDHIDGEFTGLVKVRGGKESQTVNLAYPDWAQVTIYRIVSGVRCAFTGPKVYWREFYSRRGRGNELPTEQWVQRPAFMLSKVAESQALRRAFPELCVEPTAEEMEAVQHQPRDITPPAADLEEPNFRDLGAIAFADGLLPSDCPYEDETSAYIEWHEGYIKAEESVIIDGEVSE